MIEAKLQSPSRLSDLSSMEVTIGEADETNVGNAALQNDSQKSTAVQRSMSDRYSYKAAIYDQPSPPESDS